MSLLKHRFINIVHKGSFRGLAWSPELCFKKTHFKGRQNNLWWKKIENNGCLWGEVGLIENEMKESFGGW